MTALEDKLNRYRQPSSENEQAKQERAERMVRQAVDKWSQDYANISIKHVPKGSYTNNTNVRQDSDVDIAVVRTDYHYFDVSALRPEDRHSGSGTSYPLEGLQFRNSLAQSLKSRFGANCDTTGSTAIELKENDGRVSADIVPSFEFRKYYYDAVGNISFHVGQKVYKTDGTTVFNYPDQQLINGRTKNLATGKRYKQLVRILKRAENDLVDAGKIEPLPSYFMECLMYRVPNAHFNHTGTTPLTDDLTAAIRFIWNATKEDGAAQNWLEPNEIKSLFGGSQKWTMADAHDLTLKVWQLFGLGSDS
jgi:hypothetical protein